jgi:hypothetical protein
VDLQHPSADHALYMPSDLPTVTLSLQGLPPSFKRLRSINQSPCYFARPLSHQELLFLQEPDREIRDLLWDRWLRDLPLIVSKPRPATAPAAFSALVPAPPQAATTTLVALPSPPLASADRVAGLATARKTGHPTACRRCRRLVCPNLRSTASFGPLHLVGSCDICVAPTCYDLPTLQIPWPRRTPTALAAHLALLQGLDRLRTVPRSFARFVYREHLIDVTYFDHRFYWSTAKQVTRRRDRRCDVPTLHLRAHDRAVVLDSKRAIWTHQQCTHCSFEHCFPVLTLCRTHHGAQSAFVHVHRLPRPIWSLATEQQPPLLWNDL